MATRKNETKRKQRKSRSVLAGKPSSYKHLYQSGANQTLPDTAETVVSNPSSEKGSETVDWRSEYSYVIKDLRTLFVISLIIFVAMIGSGFLFT